MDHTTALAELLSQYGFRRHALVRKQVGHLQLVGLLQNVSVDILLDPGAASVGDQPRCGRGSRTGDLLAASQEAKGALFSTVPLEKILGPAFTVRGANTIKRSSRSTVHHPRAQRNAFHRRDVRQQSRLFALRNPSL